MLSACLRIKIFFNSQYLLKKMFVSDVGSISVFMKRVNQRNREKGTKILKNAFFSITFKKGSDKIYLCMIPDFEKCKKQDLIERFIVTEHRG